MMKALLAVITITYAAEHPCIPPELCPKGQLEHCVANLSLGACVVGVCAERKTVPKGNFSKLNKRPSTMFFTMHFRINASV